MFASTAIAESVNDAAPTWYDVCAINDILPFTGVAALIDGQQIAIFRLPSARADAAQCCAISNYDPFSKANVISRGLVGDKNGILKVASPIYRNTFNLLTGQCLEDQSVRLRTWSTRIVDGVIQIAIS